ncbi:MAG: hypothetical protein GXY36_16910 [Chloroflexi bacterium]|nr:hypothetical protein [Chloroflexota bacterium]
MSGWDIANCVNHPDRIAVERCEVCNKPLCAYCLYYTEDGQRLCTEHADQARQIGLHVEAPGLYAEQLIGAQAGIDSKRKRSAAAVDPSLYQGNSNDLMSLLGIVISVVSLAACCGGAYCLPLAGLVFSVIALINAKNAHDPSRTRKLGLIGVLVSGVWVLALAGCIAFYGLTFQRAFTTSFSGPGWQQIVFPTATPALATDTPTPTPTDDDSDVSAFFYGTPAPDDDLIP